MNLLNLITSSNPSVSIPSVTAELANHRYDAVCTYTEVTDQLSSASQAWEMYCYKNNIKGTVFDAEAFINETLATDAEAAGRIRWELYHRTDTSDNLTEIQAELAWFNSVFGRNPSALSYRNGNLDNVSIIQSNELVFAGRNSAAILDRSANGDSYYGTGLGIPDTPVSSDWVSKGNTSRIWETSGTDAEAEVYCIGQLTLTKSNNGWHNNFMHAGDPQLAGNIDFTDGWLDAVNTEIGSDLVYRTSYGEAAEYAFLRNSVTSVVATYNNNQISVVVEKDTQTNHDLITVPISIKVDISNTPLSGNEISTDSLGIRKVSTDVFVVDIEKGTNGGNVSATLSATSTPDYYDFSLPSIVSCTLSGLVMTVVTNVPTRVTTWIANRSAAQETCAIHKRSNTLQTSHAITIDSGDESKDIYVALLSAEEQSILSPVYQFSETLDTVDVVSVTEQ